MRKRLTTGLKEYDKFSAYTNPEGVEEAKEAEALLHYDLDREDKIIDEIFVDTPSYKRKKNDK